MPSPSPCLDAEQLDDLQAFLRDWLKHSGRTQADLRRALRLPSIRMPVLLAELERIHSEQGLAGLVEKLCTIEAIWRSEEGGDPLALEEESDHLASSFGQLDLLLEEIRQEGAPPA